MLKDKFAVQYDLAQACVLFVTFFLLFLTAANLDRLPTRSVAEDWIWQLLPPNGTRPHDCSLCGMALQALDQVRYIHSLPFDINDTLHKANAHCRAQGGNNNSSSSNGKGKDACASRECGMLRPNVSPLYKLACNNYSFVMSCLNRPQQPECTSKKEETSAAYRTHARRVLSGLVVMLGSSNRTAERSLRDFMQQHRGLFEEYFADSDAFCATSALAPEAPLTHTNKLLRDACSKTREEYVASLFDHPPVFVRTSELMLQPHWFARHARSKVHARVCRAMCEATLPWHARVLIFLVRCYTYYNWRRILGSVQQMPPAALPVMCMLAMMFIVCLFALAQASGTDAADGAVHWTHDSALGDVDGSVTHNKDTDDAHAGNDGNDNNNSSRSPLLATRLDKNMRSSRRR